MQADIGLFCVHVHFLSNLVLGNAAFLEQNFIRTPVGYKAREDTLSI